MTDAVTDRVEEESGTTVKLGYSKKSFSVSQASAGSMGFYRDSTGRMGFCRASKSLCYRSAPKLAMDPVYGN